MELFISPSAPETFLINLVITYLKLEKRNRLKVITLSDVMCSSFRLLLMLLRRDTSSSNSPVSSLKHLFCTETNYWAFGTTAFFSILMCFTYSNGLFEIQNFILASIIFIIQMTKGTMWPKNYHRSQSSNCNHAHL